MNHTTILRALAGVLLAGLLVAACADPDGADAGAGSGQGATTAPTTTTVPTTTPGTARAPTSAAGEVTLIGRVGQGVEPGCLLLDAEAGGRYLLIGGDRDALTPGARVAVTGRVDHNLLSTCQQGVPLVVAAIEPAS
jgi:Protein of unknown function (DUF5818)